jgi:DNA-binding transcriptional MerR regulator
MEKVIKAEMTTTEAADFLGVTRKQILALMKNGLLEFRRYSDENKILWIDLVIYQRKLRES